MCVNPIRLRSNDTSESRYGRLFMTVPCGHCVECLHKYHNSTALRIKNEFAHYGYKAVFVTLTYAPERVPTIIDNDGNEFLSLNSGDVQRYIHSIRVHLQRAGLSEKIPVRYFCAQEYGSKNTHRPHYHIMFFGITSWQYYEHFQIYWKEGFQYVKNCYSSKIAVYISKYCQKGDFSEIKRNTKKKTLLKRPHNMVSQFFGFHLTKEQIDSIRCGYDSPSHLLEAIKQDYINTLSQNEDLPNIQILPMEIAKHAVKNPRCLLARVCNNISNYFYYDTDGKCFVYTLPRSWQVQIFGNRYIKRPCSKYRYRACPYHKQSDCPFFNLISKYRYEKNALEVQMALYFMAKSDDLYNSEFQSLSAIHPDWSRFQVDSFISDSARAVAQKRSEGLALRLSKYYSQSIF